jgi:hypothetical protein
MRAFKAIAAVAPGPAVLFISKWLDAFSRTPLVNPEWRIAADQIALAVGAFVAIFICLVLKDSPTGVLKVLAWVGFTLTISLLVACWLIWIHLGPPEFGERQADSPWWQDLWETLYVGAMILLVGTISVVALSLKDEKPKWFWALVLVPVVALIFVAAYAFWWR